MWISPACRIALLGKADLRTARERTCISFPLWQTHRSGSSTQASADSPSPARCSTSCRTNRSSTSATPPASRTDPKPIAEVREYALECLDHLVDAGVKMLVIACNSASAAMLRDARERYDVPVVEVILPAARRAVAATRNHRVGVICTRATAQSLAYEDGFAAAPQVELFTRACPRFVDVRRVGRDVRAGAARGGPRVPRPVGRGRRRHADPRLHALPAADRRDLVRDGRRRHAGLQRRGVRQGRLRRPDQDRRCSARTTCPSRGTASSPPAARTSSPRSAPASSARSSPMSTSSPGSGRRSAPGRLAVADVTGVAPDVVHGTGSGGARRGIAAWQSDRRHRLVCEGGNPPVMFQV